MDVAALSLSVDSSDVVKAANDLDRFAASAAKAGAAANKGGGGAAAATGLSRTAQSAVQAAAMVDKYANSATRAAADAQRMAASANAAGSSLINFGTGVDLVTGKLDRNLVAINRSIAGWGRHSVAVNDNARGMQGSMGNVAAQFQDIGVTAAMGMNPMLIALQQGTQLSAAFADGGLKSLGAALRSVISITSLLTIGIVAAVAALIQWGIEALTSADSTDKLGKAIQDTQITTYALGDAQTALGNVFDLTTGKIKSQSEALRGLARAQLEVIRATAIKDRADAQRTIAEQRGRNTPTIGRAVPGSSLTGIGITGATTASEQQRLLDRFTSGKLTSTQAIDGMERLREAGKLTEEQFIALTGAVASFGVAGENLKVYEDARKALNGDQGALKQFLNLNKTPKTPKGPKSDAEKLVDIYASAQADIAVQKARSLAEANQIGAFEAAKLEKQTALLNSVQQKGIPITDAVRKKVADLADEYAKFKTAADVSAVVNGVTDDIQKQRDAIADRTKLIGLYGDALARATRELDAQRRLRESLPRDEVVVIPNLTGGLSDDLEREARAKRQADLRREIELTAYALDLERGALGLTGKAALEYAFVAEKLNAAKRAGIELSPAEVAAIEAAGAAYAGQRYAIDQAARAIADAREVTRGFFADWINSVREGGNVFKSFADSVVNSLNRIIDKLLDRTLDSFLDSLFSSGSGGIGGFFSKLFGGGSSASATANTKAFPNALGGVYGAPQRFANDGAFTNTVVNTPTLFRFANGAALGEMGEAGPEAIMPLKRGPDGSLGVQMHGGGAPKVRMGDITNVYRIEGAVTPDMILAMVRQGGQATYDQVKKDLQSLLAQIERDGAIAT